MSIVYSVTYITLQGLVNSAVILVLVVFRSCGAQNSLLLETIHATILHSLCCIVLLHAILEDWPLEIFESRKNKAEERSFYERRSRVEPQRSLHA